MASESPKAKFSSGRFKSGFVTQEPKVRPFSKDDKIVEKHLDSLYQTMLEPNLCRITEPYSKVQKRPEIRKIK